MNTKMLFEMDNETINEDRLSFAEEINTFCDKKINGEI
jgi:hypothetical protein